MISNTTILHSHFLSQPATPVGKKTVLWGLTPMITLTINLKFPEIRSLRIKDWQTKLKIVTQT